MSEFREKCIKGIKRPHRIPPYIFNTRIKPIYNTIKYEVYRRRHGIPDQRALINEFISQQEYALVILDACRFDYFQRLHGEYLRGDLQRVWSPANLTPAWLPAVWPDTYEGTYVSANPNAGTYEYDMGQWNYRLADHFAEVIDVWDFGWDLELQATPPSAVTDISLEVAARDEETQLVVHYLQPHQPYCGEYGFDHWVEQAESDGTSVSEAERRDFLENASELTIEEVATYNVGWGDLKKYDISLPDSGVRKLMEAGKITDEELHRAYRSNLDLVLPEVVRLVEGLECPAVVTSDHGDLLGERGQYMHRPTSEIAHRNLREVPWFVVDPETIGTAGGEVTTNYLEEHDHVDGADEAEIEERLAHLGYK